MRIFKIDRNNPDKKIISLAAEIIKSGGVALYPTDTIYGLGANALDKSAIGKIYDIKKRPAAKPLSVVISDIKMAKKYCAIGKSGEKVFQALLPGPFTLIFPQKKIRGRGSRGAAKIFTAFKNTLSIRFPDFKITKLLSGKLKIPFTATSANISGFPGSGDIRKVLRQLKNKKKLIDLVLDAGVLPKRNPSMIVDLTGDKPKILRK